MHHVRPPLIISTAEIRAHGQPLGRVRWTPNENRSGGDWLPAPDGPTTIWIHRAAAFALDTIEVAS